MSNSMILGQFFREAPGWVDRNEPMNCCLRISSGKGKIGRPTYPRTVPNDPTWKSQYYCTVSQYSRRLDTGSTGRPLMSAMSSNCLIYQLILRRNIAAFRVKDRVRPPSWLGSPRQCAIELTYIGKSSLKTSGYVGESDGRRSFTTAKQDADAGELCRDDAHFELEAVRQPAPFPSRGSGGAGRKFKHTRASCCDLTWRVWMMD
ncbi:hypothetical protein BC826DRAFT_144477 [Russula brevipes]|nr:hypothetical protein BC826DRAFT_144477 [Russula brevipes]